MPDVVLEKPDSLGATHNSARRRLLTVVGVLVLAWSLACGLLYGLMRQSPDKFARVMARVPGPVAFLAFPFETLWIHARAGQLQVGDPAPNFSLMKLDKSATIQLAAFTARRQPVVLIFGSYT